MRDLSFLEPIAVKNKIRLGTCADGGYVVYKPSLSNIDILMSYGVGWDTAFEEGFYKATSKKVYMYDPTMFGDKMVDSNVCKKLLKRVKLKALFKYIKKMNSWKKKLKYLSEHDMLFVNEGLADTHTGKYNTFANHLKQNQIEEKKILLKIDIEENEYPVFKDLLFYDNLKNTDQILIEFHNLKNRLRELKFIIDNFKNAGFEIIHIHGNNCGTTFTLYNSPSDIVFPDVIEMTLVKSSSILPEDITGEKIKYPIQGLDFPNSPRVEDYDICFVG